MHGSCTDSSADTYADSDTHPVADSYPDIHAVTYGSASDCDIDSGSDANADAISDSHSGSYCGARDDRDYQHVHPGPSDDESRGVQ